VSGDSNLDRDRSSVSLLPRRRIPFQAPTDETCCPLSGGCSFGPRTCVFGYGRRLHGPAMSVVYYIQRTTTTCSVLTMIERAKAKAVARTARAPLYPRRNLPLPTCKSIASCIDDDGETLVDVSDGGGRTHVR